jgi:23S rRNA (cytidine1920-2'-O)/16S rRNA (cytidine1409-2'-O)-methyltransferase
MDSRATQPTDRLDKTMLDRGLVRSRAQAQDFIRRGLVTVDGVVATRSALAVRPSTTIVVAGDELVSRGAVKLSAALDHFAFPVGDRVALDIGASTGGFTQVLLARGAARVYAVDVGHGQLDARIAHDPRVVALEKHDVRKLDRAIIPELVDAIVADVSFISLTKALPAALSLAGPDAWLIALVKPQFEAGRAAVGKGGIVRDSAARQRAVHGVRAWFGELPHWRVIDVIASPIRGGSGNEEFLLGARRHG